MFNGVGVPTARGTGTSGYVQGNKALLKGHPGNRKRQRDHKRIKEPEKDVVLIEHEKARIIEVAVLEYEDDLRESHPEMTEQEIEQKVRQKRNSLESDLLPQPHSDGEYTDDNEYAERTYEPRYNRPPDSRQRDDYQERRHDDRSHHHDDRGHNESYYEDAKRGRYDYEPEPTRRSDLEERSHSEHDFPPEDRYYDLLPINPQRNDYQERGREGLEWEQPFYDHRGLERSGPPRAPYDRGRSERPGRLEREQPFYNRGRPERLERKQPPCDRERSALREREHRRSNYDARERTASERAPSDYEEGEQRDGRDRGRSELEERRKS